MDDSNTHEFPIPPKTTRRSHFHSSAQVDHMLYREAYFILHQDLEPLHITKGTNS